MDMDKNHNITTSTTIGELRKVPEFAEFAEYLIIHDGMPKEELEKLSIQDVGRQQADSMVESLNWMRKMATGEKIGYDYWNEEEKKECVERERTKLLFFRGKPRNPYIIVCAGGAYQAVCNFMEAFPAAFHLNKLGYSVFVLTYRVTKSPLLPAPQEDLAQALRYIRENAGEFHVPAEDYAVCGFSAGGHLAASWGSVNMGYQKYGLPAPGVLMLGYPSASVYSFDLERDETKSYLNTIIGKHWTPELFNYASVEKNIDKNYPPVYLIHSQDDDTVPFHTAELQVEKYQELGIPYEFRIVHNCGHGFGTGALGEADGWLEDAAAFWEKQRNKRWFRTEKINNHITRIIGAANEMMYLVEGDTEAALIDTGMGIGKLREFVETLTHKPVKVLISHGHMDHAMAGCQFDDVYMNPADDAVYRKHSVYDYRKHVMEIWDENMAAYVEQVKPLQYHPIHDGEEYRLGNLTIQALSCSGHTKGSMVFLIKEDRLLFLGDACNTNTLVYDEDSTTIEEYKESLSKLEEKTKGKYDGTIFSHDTEIRGTELIRNMIRLCDDIMDGKSDKEPVKFIDDWGLMARKRDEYGRRKDGGDVNIMYEETRIFK